jgi:hypothetical protein
MKVSSQTSGQVVSAFLSTVLDGYSREILAWKHEPSMRVGARRRRWISLVPSPASIVFAWSTSRGCSATMVYAPPASVTANAFSIPTGPEAEQRELGGSVLEMF